MSDYKVTDAQLTSVANAIRAKTGKSAQIEFPTEFVSEIGSINSGGGGEISVNLKKFINNYSHTATSSGASHEGCPGIEYIYNIYDNSSIISDCNLVLLGDFSQGGNASGNLLSDSINNYSGILLQGIYNKQRTSGYNTTFMYMKPNFNESYWAGMRDRASTYTCNVIFTSDTTVDLSGNRQVIIYGLP